MTSLSPHLFWITSRTAGISAMVLASASVGLGLSMAARLRGGRLADRRVLHEALSIAVMVSIVVHAGALLFDGYLAPSLADVSVPFAFGYETAWTTIGILSGWGTILFGLAYYARRRIGHRRWKTIHRLTLVTWMGGLVHTLGEGTNAGQAWFLALLGVAVAPSLVLLGLRVAGRAPRPVPSPAGDAPVVAARPTGRPAPRALPAREGVLR